jgi:hypothetical protein
MRPIYAALLALALIAIAQPGHVSAQAACPEGYVDCGRGLCCPR